MAAKVKCPTCRRDVEWAEGSQFRPFCSDRCRLIDLGAWLTETHKIPGETGGAQDQLQPDQPAEES
jgi:uncharacterized protein